MKYFLHDTNAFQDEKITELYMHFGYEGLGLFYTCLEKLAMQEKPVKTSVLKKQLNVGKKLEKCWNFMESLGILSSNNGETFNKQLLNFSEKYQIKSEKNRKKVSEWREKQADTENVTGYVPVRNPTKVNKSKVNKSKVNNDLSGLENPGENKEEKPIKIYSVFKNFFLSFYLENFKENYYFTAQDGKKITDLLKKITFKVKEKNEGIDPPPEEIAAAAEFYVKSCFDTADEFLKSNFTLSILDSHFNKLFIKIKNGNSTHTGKYARNSDNGLTPAQRAYQLYNN